MEEEDWVHVMAVDAENRVALVRQYRYPTDSTSYELPGGHSAPGEAMIDCAKRELLEETGCEAVRWRHITTMLTGARHNNRLHLYAAEQARVVADVRLEATECLTVEFAAPSRVLELVRLGEVDQCYMIGMILAGFLDRGWLSATPPI